MTFEETLNYLEKLGETRMRLDLGPTKALLELAQHPDRMLTSVVVAGTNGKGSTCAFLSSIVLEAGLRVGVFSSPHLESPAERIAINGQQISPELFAEVATDLKTKIEAAAFPTPTYFEFVTVMAAMVFLKEKVQLAIFEVGLGGRLDSTNALAKVAVCITRIDFDHMAILGNSLTRIAAEKAAIMAADAPAITVTQYPEVEEMFERAAQMSRAHLLLSRRDYSVAGSYETFIFRCSEFTIGPCALGLRGDHQITNAGAAVALAWKLSDATRGKISFTPEQIAVGLAKAKIPGRLERWTKGKKVVWLDVAHNPGAALALRSFFQLHQRTFVDMVLGMLGDKDWREMLGVLTPIAKSITFCKPNSTRAWDPNKVAENTPLPVPPLIVPDPVEALLRCLENSDEVLVAGSFYVVGPARTLLKKVGFVNG